MTKRNGPLFSLEEIAREAKMFSTLAPAIKFQGGKYRIRILSREEAKQRASHPSPRS